ncbi:MAG: molecular chaperone HtpG [Myxococcales bacterium]|nr:molecular chaperone HtpG [Myxococcales bacterium]
MAQDSPQQSTAAEGGSGAKTQKFKAEVSQVLSLVINSLYSNKEIFLRELISNAADALDKRRFESIEKPKLSPEGYAAKIRLIPDAEAKTLTVWDNGIGMGRTALAKDLGTVARSGTKEFAQKLAQAQKQGEVNLIGQFGVGFYSGYLVADRIDVVSRAAGSNDAHLWSSDGKESFSVEASERDEAGTSVVLHLADDQLDFLEEYKLRELVRRYSDFIDYPIELRVKREEDGETAYEYEAINRASALWTRPKSEISDEQYEEFYKHLTHDWEPALGRTHFAVEGTQMFSGLLFVPKNPPFDLLSPESKHGVRLYVRRVFIMDDCEELLPRWLRFVRGVVDSDDLPLNVSRELLQDSVVVRTIRKQVIRRVLDLLGEIAEQRPDDYQTFWQTFGSVLKEGLHFDPSHKDKIGKLLRYHSSRAEGLRSLSQYIEAMPEGQESIYYAQGPSLKMLETSPHLEQLRKRGYEVLFMVDGVDQWAIEGLGEFEGKSLVNAMEAGLDLGREPEVEGEAGEDDGEKKEDKDKDASRFASLLEACQKILDEHVSEVRISARLTDSPVCLVLPKGGLPAHLERLIRSYQQDLPVQKRILELNPDHPLVERLRALQESEPEGESLRTDVEMLYDQALLTEGSPLPDPARFAARVAKLMESRG